jgi:hypothetical protein
MAVRSLGIRMQNQIPNEENLKRAAKDGLFVKVRLDPI